MTEPLTNRSFSGTISSDWRVASFTSFAAHEAAATELADRDETGPEIWCRKLRLMRKRPKGKSIFTFPRGAQAGIFLHGSSKDSILPDTLQPTVSAQVEKGLEKYGYDKEWQPHVCAMINNVVTTPLASPEGSFSLSGLERGDWMVELEFFFPLRFITSDILRNCLQKWCGADQAADLAQVMP